MSGRAGQRAHLLEAGKAQNGLVLRGKAVREAERNRQGHSRLQNDRERRQSQNKRGHHRQFEQVSNVQEQDLEHGGQFVRF